ncbi:hypothetical protein EG329_013273 [Mollisiaceae sp. DMI_Dod_QoI]|nr:hypothetical protein EG329_013273 [Helotiales sp. DMI_Dod_QoI]
MNTQPSESELEVAMAQEFFSKGPPNLISRIASESEKNVDGNGPILEELEELMRQAFLQPQQQSSGQYLYRPFETKNSIRLFELKPGSREDPIEGRLVCRSFDSKPKYEALSYAWGSSAMHHHILTDEGTIPMTASVRSALTRLRLESRVRVLWIDALCINQRDNEEKSDQIMLMPKIYSSASRVVVHLGQQSDRSDLVLKLIEKIAKTSFFALSGKFVSDSALTRFGLPHGRDKIWKQFRTFWARPWFRRIWIIQEFVLAKDITMICGEWEGSWEIFSDAIVKINEYRLTGVDSDVHQFEERLHAMVGSMLMLQICTQRVVSDRNEYLAYRLTNLLELGDTALKEAEVGEPYLATMAKYFESNPNIAVEFSKLRKNDAFDRFAYFGLSRPLIGVRKFSGLPLIDLITFLEAAEATNPRDRLFALLSLANDLDEEELQLLRPHYKEEVKSVVCRYASVLVRKGYCMKILYHTFMQPEPNNLPSWIGDWITPVNPISKKTHIAFKELDIYKSGGDSRPNARIGDAPDVLIVSGGLVDTIDCVGIGPIMARTGGPLLPTLVNAALDNVDAIFETLSSYPTGESLFEIKWRTLIANKTPHTHGEAPEWYGDLFRRWRDEIKGMTVAPTEKDLYSVAPEEYFFALSYVSTQKLCRTRYGYVGLVPTSAEVGDHVCVLSGAIVPFVIRDSDERPGMFRMVGGCYVHGIMKGEAFELPHWRERSLELH